jgi:hypothetical protein
VPLNSCDGRGRRRFAWCASGALLIVALFYFAAPFSVRVEPITLPARLTTFPPQTTVVRAACAAPWRQLVSPPSMHTTVNLTGRFASEVQHNRQPLCQNTGRSRALFSGWLFLAALALIVVAIPSRLRRATSIPADDSDTVDHLG